MKLYRHEKILLAHITPGLRKRVLGFVGGISPQTSMSYTESRMHLYHELLITYRGEEIRAVQFLSSFKTTGKTWSYLGPLFSAGGAFFPMFTDWLERTWNLAGDDELFLSAEFQNPELFLFFKTIFGSHAFPCPVNKVIPPGILEAAGTFAAMVPHISQLNTGNLSCTCKDTIYNGNVRHEVMMKWMVLRDVDIRKGQTQMLIVHLKAHDKKAVIADLKNLCANRELLKYREAQMLNLFNQGLQIG